MAPWSDTTTKEPSENFQLTRDDTAVRLHYLDCSCSVDPLMKTCNACQRSKPNAAFTHTATGHTRGDTCRSCERIRERIAVHEAAQEKFERSWLLRFRRATGLLARR
jgi:hypothetical protein